MPAESSAHALRRDCDEWLRRLPAAVDAALTSYPVPHASVYTRVEGVVRAVDALATQGGAFVPVRLGARNTRVTRSGVTVSTGTTTTTAPATAAAATMLRNVPPTMTRVPDVLTAASTASSSSSNSADRVVANNDVSPTSPSSSLSSSATALQELKARMKVVSLQLRQAQQRRDDLLLAEDEDNDASDALARADGDIRQLEDAFRQLRQAQATLLQRASTTAAGDRSTRTTPSSDVSRAAVALRSSSSTAAYSNNNNNDMATTTYANGSNNAYSSYGGTAAAQQQPLSSSSTPSFAPASAYLERDLHSSTYAGAGAMATTSSMPSTLAGAAAHLSSSSSSSLPLTTTHAGPGGFSWEAYEQQGGLHNLTREALNATADVVLPVNPTHAYAGERFAWSRELRRTMRDVFGLHEYRHCQLEIINACMDGRDVFVLLPTGGGKSLCYQLPALLPNPAQVTIVFSPLLSLIQDQVYALVANDIPAMALTGQCSDAARRALFAEWAAGHIVHTLVYVTPEYFGHSDHFMRQLRSLAERGLLNRFVIDEAHCLSQWGHDFRRDYRKLTVLKTQFAQTPITALTATATAPVQQDIIKTLALRDAIIFRGSFNRANLRYAVQRVTGKEVVSVVRELVTTRFARSACGIVYCLSKRDCEDMAAQLTRSGVRAAYYHASASNKNEKQERWTRDEVQVICATIAFGMGINKPDVRFVIHAAMPKSLEGYYQESGRAGRDGLASECILLCSSSDRQRQERLIHGSSDWRASLTSLYRMLAYTLNNVECRRRQQLSYFGEDVPLHYCLEQQQQQQQQQQPQQMCDNCASKQSEHWTVREEDVAPVIVDLLHILVHLGSMTGKQLTAVYRGTSSEMGKVVEARMRQKGAPAQYKSGAKRPKEVVERALLEALLLGVLRERLESVNDFAVCAFVEPAGDGAAAALLRRLERREQRVTLYVRGERVLPPPPPPQQEEQLQMATATQSTRKATRTAATATTRRNTAKAATAAAATRAARSSDGKENVVTGDESDDVPLATLYTRGDGGGVTAATTTTTTTTRTRRRTMLTLSTSTSAAATAAKSDNTESTATTRAAPAQHAVTAAAARKRSNVTASKYVLHESTATRRRRRGGGGDDDDDDNASSLANSDDDHDLDSFIDDDDDTATTTPAATLTLTTTTQQTASADVTPQRVATLRKRVRASASLSSCISSASSSSSSTTPSVATQHNTSVHLPPAELQRVRAALQSELEALVQRLAEYAEGGRQYNVMPKKTIHTLVDTLTQPRWGSVAQFVDLEGMGKNKVRKFGVDILTLYRRFRSTHLGDVAELSPQEAEALRQVKATVSTTRQQQQQQQQQQKRSAASGGHVVAGVQSSAHAHCTPPQQQPQQATSGLLLLDVDTPVRSSASPQHARATSNVTPEHGHAHTTTPTTTATAAATASMTQPRRTVFSFAATREGAGSSNNNNSATPAAVAPTTSPCAAAAAVMLPSQSLPLFPDPHVLAQQHDAVHTHAARHTLLGAAPTQAARQPQHVTAHHSESATHSTDYLFSLCEQAQRRTPLRAATPPPPQQQQQQQPLLPPAAGAATLAVTTAPAAAPAAAPTVTRPRRQSAKDLLAVLGSTTAGEGAATTRSSVTTSPPVYSVDDDV